MSTRYASMYLLNFIVIVCVSLLSFSRPSSAVEPNKELPVFYYTKPAISTQKSGVISKSYIRTSDGKVIYTLNSGNDISGLAVNSKGEVYFGILSDDPYKITLNKIDEEGNFVSLGTVSDAGGNGSYRYADSGFNIAINSKDEIYYTTPVRSDGNGNIGELAKIKSYSDKKVVYSSSFNFTGLAFDFEDNLYFAQEDKIFKYRNTPFSYIFRSHGDIRGLAFLTETRVVFGVQHYGPLTVHAYEKELFDELQPEGYAGVTITTDTSAPDFENKELINAHWVFSVARYPPQIHVLAVGIGDSTASTWDAHKSAKRVANAFKSLNMVNEENVKYLPLKFRNTSVITNDNKDLIRNQLGEYTREGSTVKLNKGDTFIFFIETHGGYISCKDRNDHHEKFINVKCDEELTMSTPRTKDVNEYLIKNISDEFIILQNPEDESYSQLLWTDDDFADIFRDSNWDEINKVILLTSCYAGGFWGVRPTGSSSQWGDSRDLAGLKKIAFIGSSSEAKKSTNIVSSDDSINGMSHFSFALELVLKGFQISSFSFSDLVKQLTSPTLVNLVNSQMLAEGGKAYGYSLGSEYLVEGLGEQIPVQFDPVFAFSNDFQLSPYLKEGSIRFNGATSSILSMMKPVLSKPHKKIAHWGGYNIVCCSRGPVTFSLTNNDVTKHEVAATCTSGSSWEGWAEAEAGQNNFTWRLAGPCSIYTGSFPYLLEEGLYYRFLARWIGTGVLITTDVYDYEPIFTPLSGHKNKAPKQSKVTYIPYTEKAGECLQPSVPFG